MTTAATAARTGGWWDRLDRAEGGLSLDLLLYAAAAAFAAITAVTSTLPPHRAWGAVAALGYAAATLGTLGQWAARRRFHTASPAGTAFRAAWVAVAAGTTIVAPLLAQAVQRAAGRTDRAQEEVHVVEQGGIRLLETGTPYLDRTAIAALPPDDQLLGYLPYQPAMALFGVPRALGGVAWWTDARVWFALATAAALTAAVVHLRDTSRPAALLRAVQFATVLPVCALTLATGGDDLPVLALCLLALACCATHRFGAAGLAVGGAAALKLFAWPVAVVVLAHAVTRGRSAAIRLAAGAVGLPVAALAPAALVDPGAFVENVLRFPLGHGLVDSPARSPFPGYLIASTLPGGRVVAAVLLAAAAVAIALRLLRRPPRTAAAAALICGYGLLAAILLMPATRFGYLLYPAVLLAWVPALGQAPPAPPGRAADRTPG